MEDERLKKFYHEKLEVREGGKEFLDRINRIYRMNLRKEMVS